MRITGDLVPMVQKIDLMEGLTWRHIADPKEFEEVRGEQAKQASRHRTNALGPGMCHALGCIREKQLQAGWEY